MGDSVMMLRSVLDPEMPLSERAAIEAAIAEIERLRAAGDALVSAFEEIPQWPEWFYKVYETWLEARRG